METSQSDNFRKMMQEVAEQQDDLLRKIQKASTPTVVSTNIVIQQLLMFISGQLQIVIEEMRKD